MGFLTSSSIQHKELKADFSYLPSPKFSLDSGASAILYNLSPANRQTKNSESSINPLALQSENAQEFPTYFNTNWQITDWLSLQAGLRYSHFNQVGNDLCLCRKFKIFFYSVTITKTSSLGFFILYFSRANFSNCLGLVCSSFISFLSSMIFFW